MTSRTPGCDGNWRDMLLTVALLIILAQLYYILGGSPIALYDAPSAPAVSHIRLTSSQCASLLCNGSCMQMATSGFVDCLL